MARDIKELFKNNQENEQFRMPENHESRFLKKLDEALPIAKNTKRFSWLRIAASVVMFFGLGYTAFQMFEKPIEDTDDNTTIVATKTLGDISPDLKKVEDYYLANINLELSKVKLTPENKDLIDGYILRLGELNTEYKKLSVELTESGPNELTVNALIDNLKFRLSLLYRLKNQLKTLQIPDNKQEII